jgi:predicted RNase H-like nuclease (RuvC/YqgF family)
METFCVEKTKPLESENDRLRSKIQDTTSENESLNAKVTEFQEKGKQLKEKDLNVWNGTTFKGKSYELLLLYFKRMASLLKY